MEYIQGSLFGKTSPEHSAATTAETSQQSSENSQDSSNQMLPICLSLRWDGKKRVFYWSVTGKLLTELMTRNSGVYPNAVRESHLWQILEEEPLPKYYLSAKACQGILKRAKRRKKTLPDLLKRALIAQIG